MVLCEWLQLLPNMDVVCVHTAQRLVIIAGDRGMPKEDWCPRNYEEFNAIP